MNLAFKLLITLALSSMVTGCSFSLRPVLDDYTGTDAAHIRIEDLGHTVIRVYKKEGDCYVKDYERRLTSPVSVMGVPTTGDKKVSGMRSSSDVRGLIVKEYSIKPDQKLTVTHYASLGTYQREFSKKLAPQANHDYDLIIGDYSITIKDLTATNGQADTWTDNICPLGFWG